MEQREKLGIDYKRARSNLLSMIILSAVNLLLILTNSTVSFPFSAIFPQIAVVFGKAFSDDSGNNLYIIIGLIIAIVSLFVYLLFYFLSEKRYGFMIASFVLFIIDTLLFGFFLDGFDSGMVIDILFHVWVLYYLLIGVKSGFKLKRATEIESVINEFPIDENWNLIK